MWHTVKSAMDMSPPEDWAALLFLIIVCIMALYTIVPTEETK